MTTCLMVGGPAHGKLFDCHDKQARFMDPPDQFSAEQVKLDERGVAYPAPRKTSTYYREKVATVKAIAADNDWRTRLPGMPQPKAYPVMVHETLMPLHQHPEVQDELLDALLKAVFDGKE